MWKLILLVVLSTGIAGSAAAQTVDQIVSNYLKNVGGIDKIKSVKTLRRTGKFVGGGGFEATVLQENKRSDAVREEFSLLGMIAISAYDGKTGWKIVPWNGKKDAESMGEEEMKSIVEDADFDGPLVDYQAKGYKIEFAGTDKFEGTDTINLKITKPNGDVYIYYLDSEFYIPIKIDTKRMVRGAEREYETVLGDYKQVAGWFLPFSVETNVKGSQDRQKTVYDSIEANVELNAKRFAMPSGSPTP
jgi:hypothetical protein